MKEDPLFTKLALIFCTRSHFQNFSQKMFPICIGIFNCIAYSAFIGLSCLADVSVWASMIGLFAVFPVSYGILFKGESKTPRKLVGVGLCIAAAIVLAMSDGSTKSSEPSVSPDDVQPLAAIEAPMTIKLTLYFLSVIFWGLSDGMSAYILNDGNEKAKAEGEGVANKHSSNQSQVSSLAASDAQAERPFDGSQIVPSSSGNPSTVVAVAVPPLLSSPSPAGKRAPLSMISITLFTSLGFCIFAAMIGGLSILLNALIHLPLVPSPDVPQAVVTCFQQQMAVAEDKANSPAYGGGLFLIFVGQLLGKIAWFAVVQLGTLSEVSSFIPLIGLDVLVTSALGIIILGERPAPVGYLGFALAGVGIWAVADSA
jgi:drug/metabolite transporter (DMT)-like permease